MPNITKMKKIRIFILLFFLSVIMPGVICAQNDEPLFPYPTVPEDSKMNLHERCNFVVYNFWDRCNIKESFSTLGRLDKAFGTWLSFMPYATADTVHLAIDRYIAAVEKAAPKEMLQVGKMAERWLYGDTAQFMSEEIYEPFCEAVVRSKKVPKADKARFEAQLKILQSSALGKVVPPFSYTTPNGDKHNLGDVVASRVILFFNDPDCFDCRMLKTRLSADHNLNWLLEHGLVKLVSIYPSEPDDEWRNDVAGYPETWEVGASGDVDTYFDLSSTPVLYYLDGKHKVLGKNIAADNLIYALGLIYNQQTRGIDAQTASPTTTEP